MESPKNHYIAHIDKDTGELVYIKYELERRARTWFTYSRLNSDGEKETVKMNGRCNVYARKQEALLALINSLGCCLAMDMFSPKRSISMTDFCDRAKWLSNCAEAAKKMGVEKI